MKVSPFFSELSSSYGYEIEDLTYDSAGDNVLASRLKVKREQFGDLLQMCDSFPVMVVPAFRGAFRFERKEVIEALVAAQPGEFPSWDKVAADVQMEPWAAALARKALAAPGGDQFMLIAVGLEYLQTAPGAEQAPALSQAAEGEEDDESEDDLGEAGEDYLSEQGFDRRS